MVKKIIGLILGILFVGLGVAICNMTKLGADPFDAFAIAVADKVNISVTMSALVIQLVLLVYVFAFNKKLIGWNTLYALVALGFYIDFFTGLLPEIDYEKFSIPNISIFLVGALILSLGVAIMIENNMGLSPYDGSSLVIRDMFKIKYFVARMAIDFIFALMAFIIGGPDVVNAGTIILVLCTGPIIQFFRNHVQKVLI